MSRSIVAHAYTESSKSFHTICRCARSSRYNVLATYAFAHRFFARLASEIFLSSLPSGFFSNLLSRLGKPFIHFFLVGEQLLDARALLHALEMRRDIWEVCKAHPQLGGAPTTPEEMRVR